MNIQQKIDLENIKYDAMYQYLKNIKEPKPRKKITLLQYWVLSKYEKLEINKAIEKEREWEKFQKIKKAHETLIRKLEYQRDYYNIRFPKKAASSLKDKKEDNKQEPIFHYDQTAFYSPFRHPIYSFKKWKWRTFDKETTLLINMELINGKFISFIRPVEDERFKIFEGTYIVDIKLAYFSLSAGMNCLDYHQKYALPIRRKWDADGINEAIKASGIIDCPAATNPNNITRFLNSTIIEQIFQGAALGKLLMIMLILIIACMATTAICTFILNGKIAALAKLLTK